MWDASHQAACQKHQIPVSPLPKALLPELKTSGGKGKAVGGQSTRKSFPLERFPGGGGTAELQPAKPGETGSGHPCQGAGRKVWAVATSVPGCQFCFPILHTADSPKLGFARMYLGPVSISSPVAPSFGRSSTPRLRLPTSLPTPISKPSFQRTRQHRPWSCSRQDLHPFHISREASGSLFDTSQALAQSPPTHTH